MSDAPIPTGPYASSPCSAHLDPSGVDPDQARDVARWRKAMRVALLEARKARSVENHAALSHRIAAGLRGVLTDRFDGARDMVLSLYWPIKGEPDLRPLMRALHDNGVTIALPLVETKAAPLVFRHWTPDTKMVRGDWNIPVPPSDAPVLIPQIALAPLVGWDGDGYRLGYGGGYFDRTLAALQPRAFVIGIGYGPARLATIFPQPHDIPMDTILTEDGVMPREPAST